MQLAYLNTQPLSGQALRVAWLRYARWLVAALTLQLTAD
jgi:hypothetical protein